MPHHSQLGARLGPRIASIVVDAQVEHLRKSADVRAFIEASAKHRFWKDIAGERDAHLSPLLDQLRGHPDTHPAVEQALGFMSTHRGELAGMLTSRTLGTAAAMGIGSGLADLLAPINQRIMETSPNLALAPADAAQAAAAHLWEYAEAEREAARNGINADRFAALYNLSLSHPDLPSLLELWRRGVIGEGEVRLHLERAGYLPQWAAQLEVLKRVVLSPADLALMQLRGIIDEHTGREIAAQSGVDAADFDRLVLATGEPPGLEQLLAWFRRGFMDEQRLQRGVRQSRVRDEWFDVILRGRFEPMATADAVEAVVRNYLTSAEGQRIAEQNGLEPDQWNTLLLAHGRPPGHGQMLQLLNRGLVDEAAVDQAVRESDIKDKYVPTLRGLRWRIPAERLLVTLVQHGAMPVARAHELLQKDGFEPDVAGAIIRAGVNQRTAGHKSLSLTAVLELYEAHALDEAQATAHIEALGYPPEDVPLLLRTAELKRELSWRNQAVGAVRSGYLAHHIGPQEAAAELAAIGVPTEQAAYLERLWAIELRAHRRTLTEAQIIHGMRQRHLTAEQAQERLEQIGYGPNDAEFLVLTAGPIPKGA